MFFIKRDPPPSIEIRILAALTEEHRYQTLFYTRREGAGEAMIKIARQRDDVALLVHGSYVRSKYCADIQCFPFMTRSFDDINKRTIIAYNAPDDVLRRWHSKVVMNGDCRLIALKDLIVKEGKTYLNGTDVYRGKIIQ